MLLRRKLSFLAALATVSVVLAACAEDQGDRGAELQGDVELVELEEGQLARVHVLLQPNSDELEPEPALQVQARFVEYRGMNEEFVRTRTDMPLHGANLLAPGSCVPSQSLESLESNDEVLVEHREMSFVDVGDLRLELGRNEVVVPMALVPDVLPYVSGVEYFHADDAMPDLITAPDGKAPITLLVDGRTLLTVETPSPIDVTAAKRDADAVSIDWEPPGSRGERMTLRLQGFDDDGPVGEEITCLVRDTGRAALDPSELGSLGLAIDAYLLRVTAIRTQSSKGQVPSFGEVEMLVEARDQALLPLVTPPR